MAGNFFLLYLKAIVVLVACLLAGINNASADLDPNGLHVCHYVTSRYVEIVVPFNGTVYTRKVVKTSCGWWIDQDTCYRSIKAIKNVLMYRTKVERQNYKVFHCCSGWAVNAQGTECTKAVCGVTCQNGGTCIAPGKCFCKPGFGGTYCQNDVDECAGDRNGQCSQQCTNTYGSFSCSCRSGFTTNDGGFTCKDIDECSMPGTCECSKTDGVCRATCTNNLGSYSCSCSNGYKLINGKCEDRNECAENLSLCDQKCINLPGMFKCECFDGFKRNATTGKCEDADECKLNNGGCSDFCHNIVGGSVCSCKTGAFLDKDRKTCKAIQPPFKGVVLCEDGNHFNVITCSSPKKIGVLYASFGRLSTHYCQTGNYTTNTRCQAKGVIDYIDRSCGTGRSACTLMASKMLYGDPCPGTSKYLQVVYECL